nr:hypothetical protein [Hymenobacter lucidus]
MSICHKVGIHYLYFRVAATGADPRGNSLPPIGAGGIRSAADAQAKLAAGALLVQLYTDFTYKGSALVSRIRHWHAGSSVLEMVDFLAKAFLICG